ncbi:DNA polymerase epsilon subunit D [[Candida] jaroonii]|uniref:DNA polymerase epsilon subunit D n=1 Tax=[Candida] jaroonii TaxID=467808 RepID=A0ACA9Y140_9ASCO|nr:DNA polymerase epsilon subunit D [[Candida] jaroonii]
MPPKGWRKNADGNYPQPMKKQELVSIDEILFPRSIVQRLAKDIISEADDANVLLSKDSVIALQRSATVFVSYLFSNAKTVAKSSDRKTINAQDLIVALERTGYSSFVPEIKQKLSVYEAKVQEKKLRKANDNDTDNEVKRLKNNSKSPVNTSTLEDEESDDDTNEVEELEPEEIEPEEMDEDEDEEDQDQGNASNPIALMSKDDGELEGSTIDEIEVIQDESSDED